MTPFGDVVLRAVNVREAKSGDPESRMNRKRTDEIDPVFSYSRTMFDDREFALSRLSFQGWRRKWSSRYIVPFI